jgi:tRNA threonylcarbamoyl adenosine modification protein (Sua5/YciO/YrdC/YwlC family)
MSQTLVVHPTHPQPRLLRQVVTVLTDGGVVALPTDACYVLACALGDRHAVDRMRAIRQLDDKHLLTLMCRDLSELSTYAQVDNRQFRFLKEWTPGAYTFILPATKEVPRRLWHASRKTIGLRVPISPVLAALLELLNAPLLCTSLIMPDDDDPMHDGDEIAAKLGKRVECIVDCGGQGYVPTTVIDMTGEEPSIQRIGVGPIHEMTGVGMHQAD